MNKVFLIIIGIWGLLGILFALAMAYIIIAQEKEYSRRLKLQNKEDGYEEVA